MKRIIEFDSIRGRAALSILIGHFLVFKGLKIEPYNFIYWFTYSPLHIIKAGHEACRFILYNKWFGFKSCI
ncbi:MAG: peptidoglycan/LPS O-acetylase OafA/YrhL [Oleiphilaceae bacterium]|jgi:peptidoglycan/LPS O-acetylase OafA/YrhL